MTGTFHVLEWLRIGADVIFIAAGVVPLVLMTVLRVLGRRPAGGLAATS
jgi:drug/metabolite transporter superfamily protein YnfA